MTTSHSVHSINPDLLTSHVNDSDGALTELESRFTDLRELVEDDYVLDDSRRDTAGRWRYTDLILTEIVDLVLEYDQMPDIHWPHGQTQYIIGIYNPDGITVDFEKLSASSKEHAHILDHDFFISSVKNAPAEKRQIADELWLEEAINRTPIYTSRFFARADIEARFLVFSAEREIELAYEECQFPDGRVQIAFSVSQEIGAGIDVKAVELRGGVTGGLVVMHEFQNRTDANNYLQGLGQEIYDIDLDGVAGLLSQTSSLKSVIASGGVYRSVESELEATEALELEANASVQIGYARDFVSDEHILYFSGDAELRAEVDVGKLVELEGAIGVDFEGERRWNSDGQSYVDLQLSLDVSVGADVDLLEKTFPGLEFSVEREISGGLQVLASAHLKLDDASANRAWEDLMNPVDGSLDVLAFLDRADVTLQVSSVAKVELVEIDIEGDIGAVEGSLEVEVGGEVNFVQHRWMKPPGEDFRKVAV